MNLTIHFYLSFICRSVVQVLITFFFIGVQWERGLNQNDRSKSSPRDLHCSSFIALGRLEQTCVTGLPSYI